MTVWTDQIPGGRITRAYAAEAVAALIYLRGSWDSYVADFAETVFALSDLPSKTDQSEREEAPADPREEVVRHLASRAEGVTRREVETTLAVCTAVAHTLLRKTCCATNEQRDLIWPVWRPNEQHKVSRG